MLNVVFVALLLAAPTQAAENPNAVKKVIGLLNEMKTQIESEAAADADMYEKMGCWCTTNKAAKTAAVTAAQQTITELNAAIRGAAAKAAQCEVDIKQLTKDIAANKKAIEEATGIREKEEAEYRTNEKDMIS